MSGSSLHKGAHYVAPTEGATTSSVSSNIMDARSHANNDVVDMDGFECGAVEDENGAVINESPESTHLRWAGYRRNWTAVERHVSDIQAKHYRHTYNQMVEFIHSAYRHPIIECREELNAEGAGASSEGQAERLYTIPTALVCAGPNVPDHEEVFTRLVNHIKDRSNATPRKMVSGGMYRRNVCTATLRSRSCGRFKAAVEDMIKQFISHSHGRSNAVRAHSNAALASINRASLWDMQTLLQWYEAFRSPDEEVYSNPRRSRRVMGVCPILVVVLEDFECFDPTVVRELVQLCSLYGARMRLLFIFGMSTGAEAVYHALPRSLYSRLKLRQFQVQPSSECLNDIVERILIAGNTFARLGHQYYNHMLENFLDNNFSILTFVRHLHHAIMDHFYHQPLSFFCLTQRPPTKLTPFHVQCILKLRSVKNYFAKNPPIVANTNSKKRKRSAGSGATQPTDLLPLVRKWLGDLRAYHRLFPRVFRCYRKTLSTIFKGTPEPMRQVYGSALEGGRDLVDEGQERIGEITRKLTFVDTSTIAGLLQDWLLVLCESGDATQPHSQTAAAVTTSSSIPTSTSTSTSSSSPTAALRTPVRTSSRISSRASSRSTLSSSSSSSSSSPVSSSSWSPRTPAASGGAATSSSSTTSSSVSSASASSSPSSKRAIAVDPVFTPVTDTIHDLLDKFHSVKPAPAPARPTGHGKMGTRTSQLHSEMVGVILLFLQEHLRGYEAYPMHEAFYALQATDELKRFLKVNLTKTFNPAARANLDKALCRPSKYYSCGSDVDHTMNDLSIVYNQYKQCGRYINLRDWLDTYLETCRDSKEPVENLKCRFIVAVGELEYLGFLRRTTRKTDHVIKSVFKTSWKAAATTKR